MIERKKYKEKETGKIWHLTACFRASWDDERIVYLQCGNCGISRNRTELFKEFEKIYLAKV